MSRAPKALFDTVTKNENPVTRKPGGSNVDDETEEATISTDAFDCPF
jgi:hypothetical protein